MVRDALVRTLDFSNERQELFVYNGQGVEDVFVSQDVAYCGHKLVVVGGFFDSEDVVGVSLDGAE